MVRKRRKNSCVIVRSSALGEDSFESAQAGTYQSILNVESKNKKKIKNAINLVIRSYEQKGNYDEKNQILIQTQSQQIHISGVVFTKTPEHGSPYYVINFEEGEFTTTVTQGLSNQVVKIFRNISAKNFPALLLCIDFLRVSTSSGVNATDIFALI